MSNVQIAATRQQEDMTDKLLENVNIWAKRSAQAPQQSTGASAVQFKQNDTNKLITHYMGGYRGLRSINDFKTIKTDYVDFMPLRRGFAIASGPNDVGKSSVIEHLAARVLLGTTSGKWHGVPRGVVFVLSEESPSDIKSVMTAQGVSDWIMQRKLFTYINGDTLEDYDTLSIPRDVDFLRGLCTDNDIGMIVFDAFVDCLDDAHLNDRKDVGDAIKPLNAWGNEEDVLLIGIHHNNKSYEGTAKQAVAGSSAFTDKPRTVMSFDKNDTDDTIMQLVKIKGTSLHPAFTCKWLTKTITKDDGNEDSIGIVDRIVPADVSIDDIRRSKTQAPPNENARADDNEVLDWIVDYLDEDKVPFDQIKKDASSQEGYTPKQLQNARDRSDGKIRTMKDPDYEGRGQRYLWFVSD